MTSETLVPKADASIDDADTVPGDASAILRARIAEAYADLPDDEDAADDF